MSQEDRQALEELAASITALGPKLDQMIVLGPLLEAIVAALPVLLAARADIGSSDEVATHARNTIAEVTAGLTTFTEALVASRTAAAARDADHAQRMARVDVVDGELAERQQGISDDMDLVAGWVDQLRRAAGSVPGSP